MKEIKIKWLLGLLFCIGMSVFFIHSSSASSSNTKDLQQSTFRFLQYVEEERYEAAEAILTELRREYSNQDFASSQQYYTLLDEAQSALQDPYSTAEEKYHKSLTVVLLYEASWNKVDPLWLSWRDFLYEQVHDILQSGTQVTNAHVQDIYYLYERIYPAVAIAGTKESNKIMNTHMDELLTLQSSSSHEDRVSTLASFAKELKDVNVKKKRSLTEEPGFIWLMGSVGSLISFTLMYVGWRKYKGEKTKEDGKQREHDR